MLALSDEGAAMLTKETAAVAFVHDAFSHLKVIGHTAGAKALMDKAGIVSDAGVVAVTGHDGKAFLQAALSGRIRAREPFVRAVF